MAKQTTVVNLDPIDRKNRQQGLFGRLLITRWSGGDSVSKTDKFGHYMFCGPQRSGKTSSALWYAEKLGKKYRRKRLRYYDSENDKFVAFAEPPVVKLWSNFSVGKPVNRNGLFKLIDEFDPYANEVRIIIIDEVHTYFPKDVSDKKTKESVKDLNAVFSQLAKRNCYILSTAQIYGRLDKALREQCLYMVDCKVNIRHRLVNDFIRQEDIICDELGRWAGVPEKVLVHGLSVLEYDTKKLIRE